MKEDFEMLPKGVRYCKVLNSFTVLFTLTYVFFLFFQACQTTPEIIHLSNWNKISPYTFGLLGFDIFFRFMAIVFLIFLNRGLQNLKESSRPILIFWYMFFTLDYYYISMFYLVGLYFLIWNKSTVEVLAREGQDKGKGIGSIVLGFFVWGLIVGLSFFLENRTEIIEQSRMRKQEAELAAIAHEQKVREDFKKSLPEESQFDESTGNVYF